MSAIGGEIAASVRAEAFGDVALQQLAEVVVLLEGFEVSEGGRQLEEQGEAMGALGAVVSYGEAFDQRDILIRLSAFDG